MSEHSKRFSKGEQHIREVLSAPATTAHTSADALNFLAEQTWQRQGSRISSIDMFQEETAQTYLSALDAAERTNLNALKQKRGVGWEISMDAKAAETVFAQHGLTLTIKVRPIAR